MNSNLVKKYTIKVGDEIISQGGLCETCEKQFDYQFADNHARLNCLNCEMKKYPDSESISKFNDWILIWHSQS